ncbi:hypothetical protein [Bacterioplanoides sp. SCSIO 12839]|uniref:hypothetical protein n=1 Tax=Bacterioplanoides sp. SCSIO 12839 TaxID=2829569 RepID=UPI002103C8FF|nr:hypothetical protein [Bacterioplanoides sp. SCSIO 12839]UTW46955.1 hypothetical protein KFF03_10125 [Bacterioplanoides sp. SCSIO 12839]
MLKPDKLKLLLLLAILFFPVPLAWSMWFWKVGVPDDSTVHGDLMPQVSNIRDWPLSYRDTPSQSENSNPSMYQHQNQRWYLIFRCPADESCVLRDQLWRMHRALGREAIRVQRWLLLPENQMYSAEVKFKGEQLAFLNNVPEPFDIKQYRVWLADPQGQVVVSYGGKIIVEDVFDDLRHLLKRNPAPPQWQAQQWQTKQRQASLTRIAEP